MKNANPVGWFEIPARDIERAMNFYESVFNISLNRQETDEYRMAWFPHKIEGSYGATGTLIQGKGYTPSHVGSLVYFSVRDIEKTLKDIQRLGGSTIIPKKSIGQHGFVAVFEDCEGNRVALHSME